MSAQSDRPNIIVIMSDEHDPAVASPYGNDVVQTRVMQRLADQGITFENAYCNSPLCVPSRLSFTACQYIHRVNGWTNDCWIPNPDQPSIASVMKNAGYDALLCGKQHYDRTRRYGFDDILPQVNTNNSYKNGNVPRRDPDDLSINRNIQSRFEEFYTDDHSNVLDHDRLVTRGAVDFLNQRDADDKPFFLFVGYLSPHFPLIVPEAYHPPYQGKVPDPEIPEGLLENQPLNYKQLRAGFGITADTPDSATITRGRELYHGLTHWLDDEMQKVMDALDQSAFADNTVVIYTSDHGENCGSHGMWWKNCMYEQAARVPMIASFPKRWEGGQRRAGACSLVDLVQTVVELVEGEPDENWDGDSMLAWMDDESVVWKDMAVSQYYGHNIASGFAMIRKGDWKYVYHTPASEKHPADHELYNLSDDPDEFNNLARTAPLDHADRMNSMHAALVEELGEHPDESEQRARAQKPYDR